jgi:hypothetical protein
MVRSKLQQRPEHFVLKNDHPLAQGLVFAGLGAHAGSTRYHDSSVFGNTGTLNGVDPTADYSFSSYLSRNCINLDGSDSSIDGVTAKIKTAVDVISCACWAKADSVASSEGLIFERSGGGVAQNEFGLMLSSAAGSPLTAYWYNAFGTTYNVATGLTLGLGEWNLCAMTMSATALIVYRIGQTGSASHTFTGTGPAARVIDNARLGYDQLNAARRFDGMMADPMIWTRTLSSTEIQILADPSNVMLSGLIQPPKRKYFAISRVPQITLLRYFKVGKLVLQ